MNCVPVFIASDPLWAQRFRHANLPLVGDDIKSQLAEPLEADRIHIGPSDYVPWQRDNKVCFIRMEDEGFGGAPIELELRLSVQDSPNSAGCGIDAIRGAKLGLDRGLSGPLLEISAYTMKHPPVEMRDSEAREQLEHFLSDA